MTAPHNDSLGFGDTTRDKRAAAHTPGPWSVDRSPRRGVLCVVSADTWICGELQADNLTSIEMVESNANARLIAASPTLYNYALKKAQEGDTDAARIIAAI